MKANMIRICLAGLMVSVFVGLMVTVIVVNSPRHASLEAETCAAGAGVFKNFQAARPPVAVPETPFFEDGTVERTIADYRGHGAVVNLWATWCEPCVREMPSLDRLQARVAARGLRVLALSGDRKGAEVVERFFARNKIANLAVLIDRRARFRRQVGVDQLPATLLVDARGFEVGRVAGEVEWDSDAVVAFILGCLAGEES